MLKKLTVILVVAAVAGLAVSSANAANVRYDLRAISATGGTVENTKSVQLSAGTGSVTMQVWAMVADVDGVNTNDGYAKTDNSFISTGALLGNLSAQAASNLQNLGYSNGLAQDLDADGDLDVGNTKTTQARTTDWFTPAAPTGAPVQWGSFAADARADETDGTTNYSSFLIGTVTFTWTAAPSGETNVNAVPRIKSGSASVQLCHSVYQDGTTKQYTGTQVEAGLPVHIYVPEPATMSVLALGALALLRRRRA